MSNIAIQGAATGTGVFTLASPATNTDRTLTLPDEAGTVLTRAAGSPDNSVVVNASGNVGIGASSPTFVTGDGLHVQRTGSATVRVERTGSTASAGEFFAGNDQVVIQSLTATAPLAFRTGGNPATERARIDSIGNLLVGKTTTASENVGVMALSTGRIFGTVNSDDVLLLRRNTTDGNIATFRKDGTTVGKIASSSTGGGSMVMGNASSGIMFRTDLTTSAFIPANPTTFVQTDNTLDVGHASIRFDDIYATNGTIQTSDRNEKQDIETLSEAEARVAVACKGLLRKFRWKDAVAEKGDEARIHFGIIAQDLQDAFAAEGLDAGRYAMFISSTWWEAERVVPAVEEVLDDEGNVVTEAVAEHTVVDSYQSAEEAPEGATERTRLGVRYPELLAFIIGAI